MSATRNQRLINSNLVKIAGLALAYALLGKLALLLAIPPGYATALFPSAGLAVAAVLLWGMQRLPGVFLGSFILNTWVNLEAGHPFLSSATLMALGIATGALLQAALGSVLVRRYVGFPTGLTDEKEIVGFLLLAGPLACLVGATVGVTALLLGGVITPDALLFSWLTWWVGDVIGVMIMAPLLLILFAQPRVLWQQRVTTVAFPLLATCAVVVAVFIQVSQSELERLKLQFREESTLMLGTVKSRLDVYMRELSALERFYAASRFVDRDEFKTFVSATLTNYPGLQALEWLPRVPQSQREPFEAQLRAAGHHQFRITERDEANELVPASVREEYFPVTYVEPYAGNEDVFGYDVASSAARHAALARARDNGAMVMTAPLKLVQRGGKEIGALLFLPVYEKGELPATTPLRRQQLKGFLLSVFSFSNLIDSSLATFPKGGFSLSVTDISDAATAVPIYGDERSATGSDEFRIGWSDSIRVGERSLRFNFSPTERYLYQHRSWQAWMVLAWGLLFASLLGAFLLLISGRASKVQQLVDRQTLELRSILDNVLEVIITFDGKGVIESVNPAAEQLFGYPGAALLNMPISRLIPEAQQCEDNESKRKKFIGKSCEVVALHRDGTAIPVEFGVSEVVLPDRKFYTGIVRDLRERNKVDRMKNEFIATVSHELRTPITSIRGALGLIDGGAVGEVPEQVAALLKTAAANSVRLVNLINDILDVEKLEFGAVAFEMRRHDISALAKKSVEQNNGFARQYGVELEFQACEEAPLWANVDEQRFIQAMANLISNAVKFSPTGSTVTVVAKPLDGQIEVQVIDHGPGIAKEHHALIFEKFGQVDASDSRKHGGTGLGLNIVKTIVEKMGGEVNFRSTVGIGTTFYIRLPLAEHLSQ